MASPLEGLRESLRWIKEGNLRLNQISEARLIKREHWVLFTGAMYPPYDHKSVFAIRPWDKYNRTKKEDAVLKKIARRKLLE